MSRSSLIFLLVFILPAICNADKIYLKDGRVIQSNAVWKDGEKGETRGLGDFETRGHGKGETPGTIPLV